MSFLQIFHTAHITRILTTQYKLARDAARGQMVGEHAHALCVARAMETTAPRAAHGAPTIISVYITSLGPAHIKTVTAPQITASPPSLPPARHAPRLPPHDRKPFPVHLRLGLLRHIPHLLIIPTLLITPTSTTPLKQTLPNRRSVPLN